jgi:hypothetical protein
MFEIGLVSNDRFSRDRIQKNKKRQKGKDIEREMVKVKERTKD